MPLKPGPTQPLDPPDPHHAPTSSPRSSAPGEAAPPSAWRVLASLGEAMAVVDRHYRLIWVREPELDPTDPPEQVVGKPCYQVLAGRSTPCEVGCPVAGVLADGLPHVVERHFVDPGGVERWREARAYPIVDKNGRVVYVARISFDITHRKQGEARMQRSYETLERSLAEMNRIQLDQMPFQPGVDQALTSRELEVLRLMAQGHKKPQIASLLGISINTVKRHVVNIFNKLGVNDRAQAAVWAARRGLV